MDAHLGELAFYNKRSKPVLDDYYLHSHTFYNREILISTIKDYINCFENNNSNLLKITFKFGRGVLPLTLELIEMIFHIFASTH